MVQDGVADHQVESVVLVGNSLSVGDPAVDVKPSDWPLRVATLTMPGERSVTEPRRATPAWIEVQQEKAGAAQPSSRARS